MVWYSRWNDRGTEQVISKSVTKGAKEGVAEEVAIKKLEKDYKISIIEEITDLDYNKILSLEK